MCTLVLAWRLFEDAPVAVAANRDEAADRPSRPPAVVDEAPRVVAPLDERAGGTWLGYNEHGLVAAITNRWEEPDREGERSRGLLVRDALARRSARAASEYVADELAARRYEPFHLVLADDEDAFLVAWDGDRRVVALEPGVHVVVNVGWDGDYFLPEFRPEVGRGQAAAADRVREALAPREGETAAAWTDRAAAVLSDHEYERCVHGDGFGTRSSSLLRLGPDGAVFEHAEGPPCETEYAPVVVE